MEFFDFNRKIHFSADSLVGLVPEGISNEHGAYYIFAVDGLASQVRIRQMRSAISRRQTSQDFHLLRSVSHDGFRPVDISGKSSRHRNVSHRSEEQALSCGNQREYFPQHSGRCERKKRLANLRRFCAGTHRASQGAVCRGGFRSRTGRSGLRIGLHNDRPVPLALSLGEVPQAKGRNQTSHASGFTREFPFYRHSHVGQGFRRENTRPACLRAGSLLHHGSGLSGFCPSVFQSICLRLFSSLGRKRIFNSPADIPIPWTKQQAFNATRQ